MMVGALIVVASLAISAFAYQRVIVPAGGMEPTLSRGDRLSVRNVSGDQVRRGDVIVFSATAWDGDYDLVKRVVGVGGDTIECCEAKYRIVVNGRGITEEYIGTGEGEHPNWKYTAKVEQGQVWVLGDNRGNSRDSRNEIAGPTRGGVPVGDIKGIVVRSGGNDIRTTAFIRAGLAGEPFKDELDKWTYVLLGVGGVLFVGGIGWLLVAVRRRGA
nr:signal peptidase I [Kibdelosporangium sp. MJ126-NF4]CEL15410.1 Signal peptidase I [Kibdelosporangium sp. MJ126-NF4]CTQ92187.1 Signal peptidase I (EC 3.4.21.89) [Kibdelosporangium sp. MJ126-NF4]